MPDYKEMYLIMARAAEKTQRILIEAQRQCEELYLSADDAEKPENGKEQAEHTAAPRSIRLRGVFRWSRLTGRREWQPAARRRFHRRESGDNPP